MKDVSAKNRTLRTAVAQASLRAQPTTIEAMRAGKIPKGDPLPVAKVAAIQAAKETSRIIPYCHPMPVDSVDVEFEVGKDQIAVTATVKALYRTGVEMEALTAAAVAALTLYDMMKMLDPEMEILGVRLVRKQGGKSDFREHFDKPLRAVVLVASDTVAAGKKEDLSGQVIAARLKKEGLDVVEQCVVSDDEQGIVEKLKKFADDDRVDLVLTSGGTGCGPRDNTPEAMSHVIDRPVPGIAETVRGYGQERMPRAMLSRGRAGMRGQTLIVNLPGSAKGAAESLDALFPGVLHAFSMMRGGGHPDPREKRS
jgi:molybdenum cofactor biosynthesis protein MoaC